MARQVACLVLVRVGGAREAAGRVLVRVGGALRAPRRQSLLRSQARCALLPAATPREGRFAPCCRAYRPEDSAPRCRAYRPEDFALRCRAYLTEHPALRCRAYRSEVRSCWIGSPRAARSASCLPAAPRRHAPATSRCVAPGCVAPAGHSRGTQGRHDQIAHSLRTVCPFRRSTCRDESNSRVPLAGTRGNGAQSPLAGTRGDGAQSPPAGTRGNEARSAPRGGSPREATVLHVKGVGGSQSGWLSYAGVAGAHIVRCLSIALRIVSSLCMQAVSASFLVLPAATKRAYTARRTGLQRLPTRAPMYRAARTVPRPPQIVRLPRSVPLSRLSGASPTSAAIGLRSSVPSSGRSANSTALTTGPMPGTLRNTFSCSRHSELPRIAWPSSRSTPLSRLRNQAMCSWISARMALGAVFRRFSSAVSISTNCRRRATRALSSRVAASGSGRTAGRTASAKWAST